MKKLFLLFIALFFAVSIYSKTAIIYMHNGVQYGLILNYDIDCDGFEAGPGITIVDCWNFLVAGGGGTVYTTADATIEISNDQGIISTNTGTGVVSVLKSKQDILTDLNNGLNVHILNDNGEIKIVSSTDNPIE